MLEVCWFITEIMLEVCWFITEIMLEVCWFITEIMLEVCWFITEIMLGFVKLLLKMKGIVHGNHRVENVSHLLDPTRNSCEK
jgi:hypothetical protein